MSWTCRSLFSCLEKMSWTFILIIVTNDLCMHYVHCLDVSIILSYVPVHVHVNAKVYSKFNNIHTKTMQIISTCFA